MNAIERLNKVIDERESMINYLLSLKIYTTDKAFDKAYSNLKKKSYKDLKNQYDKEIKKMFG